MGIAHQVLLPHDSASLLNVVSSAQSDSGRGLLNTGKMVWRWHSGPFGEGFTDADLDHDGRSVTFNLRFPGQYFDAKTRLHYNYFREYDPAMGRYN